MRGIVLYDDHVARDFAPFALTRPCGELRAGAALIRERWQRALGASSLGFIGAAHLADFEEFEAPAALRGVVPAGAWLVNSRCAPALAALAVGDTNVLRVGDEIAAVRPTMDIPVEDLVDGRMTLESVAAREHGRDPMRARSIDGWWLGAAWDLIGQLPAMLLADATALLPAAPQSGGMTVLGAHGVHVEEGAQVEPFVIADATAGPVIVRRGTQVQAFTRLVGPCVIDEGCTVQGGRLATVSIGPKTKVCGEMSVTIMLGHANKGHDGFVGHSVIGRWANFGAGTITSNLKNSYGEVTMWAPGGARRTGLQFLGSLVGDHVKTGIGTRLSTGTVLGAGANVFGTRMPPKVVPPFAWGDGEPWEHFDRARFLTVAERVMARRGVSLGARAAAYWTAVFARREHP